jgi:topoisomerase-4 subunit B
MLTTLRPPSRPTFVYLTLMSGNLIETYSEESIKTLEPKEHIRLRPGMYIGKLGDGSAHDDGIYVLLKEVIDNS